MDADGELVVSDWQPHGMPRRTRGQSRYRISARLLGVIGTLIVHSAVLQSLIVLGTPPKKVHRPLNTGPGSTTIAGERMADEPLVLLQPIETPASAMNPFEELASRGVAPRAPQIALLSPDPAPPAVDLPADAKDDPTSDTEIARGDPAGRARLFGLYTGQLQARIERIWRRPRSPISELNLATSAADETFTCQVQVLQDAHGYIEEILLTNCNGSTAWQQSLVSAFREASPLPPPSDQKLYSKSITLTFVAHSYRPGDPPDNYELISTPTPRAARNH